MFHYVNQNIQMKTFDLRSTEIESFSNANFSRRGSDRWEKTLATHLKTWNAYLKV